MYAENFACRSCRRCCWISSARRSRSESLAPASLLREQEVDGRWDASGSNCQHIGECGVCGVSRVLCTHQVTVRTLQPRPVIPAETQLPARHRRHPQAESESYLHFLSSSALSVANAGGGTARSRQLRLHTQRRVLLQRRQRAVRRGVRSIAAVNEARRTSEYLWQRGRNAAVHRHRVSNGTAPDRPGKVLGHRDCDGRRPGHPLPKPWICSWHHRTRRHTNRRALPNTGATTHPSRGIPANYASP